MFIGGQWYSAIYVYGIVECDIFVVVIWAGTSTGSTEELINISWIKADVSALSVSQFCWLVAHSWATALPANVEGVVSVNTHSCQRGIAARSWLVSKGRIWPGLVVSSSRPSQGYMLHHIAQKLALSNQGEVWKSVTLQLSFVVGVTAYNFYHWENFLYNNFFSNMLYDKIEKHTFIKAYNIDLGC